MQTFEAKCVVSLEVSAQGLLSFDGFEQRFEISFAKRFGAVAFDNLKK
jgi:hypothetical protein